MNTNISSLESSLSEEYTLRTAAIDRGVIIGAVSGVVIFFGVMAFSGSFLSFIDLPSILLVVGGTFSAGLIQFSPKELLRSWESVVAAVRKEHGSAEARIVLLSTLAQQSRKEGLLSLEVEMQRTEDPFLALGLSQIIDGRHEEVIRRTLELDNSSLFERSNRAVQVLTMLGGVAPAMGLIGTILGLVQMLNVLDDTASLGPAMSLALLTTLYGALISNLILLPLAGKVQIMAEKEGLLRRITIEGLMGILKEESPLVLEPRLQAFLPR